MMRKCPGTNRECRQNCPTGDCKGEPPPSNGMILKTYHAPTDACDCDGCLEHQAAARELGRPVIATAFETCDCGWCGAWRERRARERVAALERDIKKE